ncbi:MAG: UDP-N-acetylmuramoyl-L-alanyl-D-glutamate--2,6-diaminopimelate ligase, partial [Nocardioides sp.]
MAGQSGVIATRPRHPREIPLRTVAEWLSDELVEIRGSDPERVVTGVTISSRRVSEGDLYVAPAGARAHGATFAESALAAGAVAVLTDPDGAALLEDCDAPVLVVPAPRAVVGDLAARLYGRPAEQLTLVAVTGTHGKTTTTRLAEAALTEAGIPAAVVGTVGTRVNGHDVATSLTTPEAPDLHGLFAVMAEEKVSACAMEVSSHALVMGRVDGVVFDLACFTNLGRDHLDFHRDLEDYYAAKATLFTPARARKALVNVDDEHGRRLATETTIPVRTFSTAGPGADWWADDIVVGAAGSTFTVHTPDGAAVPARVPLTGDYNVSNALCAVAALGEVGFDPAAVCAGLAASAGVPGRLERVDAGQDFLAVVDYAHKPDAVT